VTKGRRRWAFVTLIAVLTVAAATVVMTTRTAAQSATQIDQTAALRIAASNRTTPAAATPAPTGEAMTTTSPPKPRPRITPTLRTTAPGTGSKSRAKISTGKTGSKAAAPSGGGVLGTGRIRYGRAYTGRGTFYGATGAGNCSYPASSNLMVGAMNQLDYGNSQACGAYLEVTGPSGKTITIRVVDRCPECAAGAIDLSRQAFAELAAPSTGQITIHWRLLSPALSGPITYTYKSGSSQYWCAIQVRNHRNPVHSLAVKVNGAWKNLPRQDYNYFVSADGAGCGGPIRTRDIYGNQVVDSGIKISPDAVQSGHSQFGIPR